MPTPHRYWDTGRIVTTIVILAILIGLIVFVLRMKPAVALEAVSGDGAIASGGKKPFALPERAKTVILFIASVVIGLIVSMYLNPIVVFVLLGAAAFAVYYRTDKGKKKVDERLGGLKTIVAKSAASATAAGQGIAQNVASAVDGNGEPIFNGLKAATSSPTDQLLDQLASSVMRGRSARKALDGEFLPGLASATDNAAKDAMAAGVKSLRQKFEGERKLADVAIRQLVRAVASDALATKAALEVALVKEDAAADTGLSALFRQMADGAETARFDEVGYQKLVQEMWLRATENPGLANSPV